MSEPTPPPYTVAPPSSTVADRDVGGSGNGGDGSGGGGLGRFRISAVIVIVLAVALIAWLVLRDNGSSSSGASSNATAATAAQIKALPKSLGHPVFWLGPKEGTTYELIQTSNGSVFVRYLPPGVAVGAKDAYLTVATYPFPGAFAAIQAVAKDGDVSTIELDHGGIAEYPKGSSTSVHAAYPGVDYQIEVFDPTPGTAAAYVSAGQLKAIGKLSAGSTSSSAPTATSPAKLRALATSLGHPIYWAGVKKGYTYELNTSSSGQVYIRYLAPGTQVGAPNAYLTVATYPYPQALTAIQGLAKGPNATAVQLAGGGIAVIDKNQPANIHLAFPGVDYQVEVYAPSAAVAKQIVSSGKVKSIG